MGRAPYGYSAARRGDALLFAGALLLVGCTPDIASTGAGGASASASTTSGPLTTSSGGATTTTTTSTTASSIAVSSSSSGTGGAPLATCLDATTCDPTGSASCSIVCVSGDPCDCDGDGAMSDAPGCPASGTPDCFDCNPDVHPSQNKFFTENRGDGSFDYDCDGKTKKQHVTGCISVFACTLEKAYDTTVACGDAGDLYTCMGFAGACTKSTDFQPNVPQGCH